MNVVQAVTAPTTVAAYTALLDSGTLLDLAGRPMTRVPCPTCNALCLGGEPCIYCDVQCGQPECRDRRTCRRPSEHDCGFHKSRWDAFEALCVELIGQGRDDLPAPWPKARPTLF